MEKIMGKKLKLIAIVALLLLMATFLMAGCSSDSSPAQGTGAGSLALDFKLKDLGGQDVSLSDWRGSPVMLNFWATWCGPCRAEMPFMQEIFEDKEWSDKGVVILAVNGGETAAQVAKFMEAAGFTFPVLLDISQNVARAYNVRNIPATFFIDNDGIIKDVKIGAITGRAEWEERLSKIIQ